MIDLTSLTQEQEVSQLFPILKNVLYNILKVLENLVHRSAKINFCIIKNWKKIIVGLTGSFLNFPCRKIYSII